MNEVVEGEAVLWSGDRIKYSAPMYPSSPLSRSRYKFCTFSRGKAESGKARAIKRVARSRAVAFQSTSRTIIWTLPSLLGHFLFRLSLADSNEAISSVLRAGPSPLWSRQGSRIKSFADETQELALSVAPIFRASLLTAPLFFHSSHVEVNQAFPGAANSCLSFLAPFFFFFLDRRASRILGLFRSWSRSVYSWTESTYFADVFIETKLIKVLLIDACR